MQRTFSLFIALVLTACAASGFAEEVQPQPAPGSSDTAADAADLVRRVLASVPKVAFEAEALLTAPGGFMRELRLLHKPVGDADGTFMEVTAPLNLKDTRFLFLERASGADEQFIYVPALKRTIQVVDDARKQPFLGSDFYVSDLVTPNLDAYDYAFASPADAEVAGRKVKLVETKPKNPQGELYSKAVIAIDPTDLLIVRSEFFDPKGALLKVWTLDKIEKVDGYWTPMTQKMTNAQTKTVSTLETKNVKYNAEIADSVFTKTYLQR